MPTTSGVITLGRTPAWRWYAFVVVIVGVTSLTVAAVASTTSTSRTTAIGRTAASGTSTTLRTGPGTTSGAVVPSASTTVTPVGTHATTAPSTAHAARAASPASSGSTRRAQTVASSSPATLSEYWNGTADWQLYQFYSTFQYGDSSGFGAGNMIVVGPDGAWDWFYRTTVNPGSTCSQPALSEGTVVRRSTDHGVTWGPQVRVISPTPGTPWACAGSDGDAYWTGSRWVYLFQCEADPAAPGQWGVGWNVCLFQNTSTDPASGTWTPVVSHPVWGDYPGGYDPWMSICTAADKQCASIAGGTDLVDQAGTPSIFDNPDDPGWYFVDFHGVDSKGNLYQGIAKTQDFLTYVAGSGQDVPTDAIYTKADSASWDESEEGWPSGDIGGGGGSVMYNKGDGMFYDVVEATNAALCTQASVYDLGILRASSTAQTAWSQPSLPGRENPIEYGEQQNNTEETSTVRCTPGYPEMFTDPATGQTFLTFVRISSSGVQGVYVFALVHNLLANGTAWRCTTTAPWHLTVAGAAADDLGISRDGAWATDGGCYFGFDSDISQTMSIGAGSVSSVTVTGEFAGRITTVMPPQGYHSHPFTASPTIDVVVTQANASGQQVGSVDIPVTLPPSGDYVAMPNTPVAIDPAAVSLSYTVELHGTPSLSVLAGGMTVQPSS